jgi:hypothetical protein
MTNQISEILINAHNRQKNSYLCPYLAIALESNFYSEDYIRTFPSQMTRMSMRKIINHLGYTEFNSNKIWRMIEDGFTLKEIGIFFKDITVNESKIFHNNGARVLA